VWLATLVGTRSAVALSGNRLVTVWALWSQRGAGLYHRLSSSPKFSKEVCILRLVLFFGSAMKIKEEEYWIEGSRCGGVTSTF